MTVTQAYSGKGDDGVNLTFGFIILTFIFLAVMMVLANSAPAEAPKAPVSVVKPHGTPLPGLGYAIVPTQNRDFRGLLYK